MTISGTSQTTDKQTESTELLHAKYAENSSRSWTKKKYHIKKGVKGSLIKS